jgi:hypothetical protein
LMADDHSEYGSCAAMVLGRYYQNNGDYDKSKAFYESALQRAVAGGYKYIEYHSRFLLGRLMTGDEGQREFFKIGMRELESAAGIVENIISKISPPEQQTLYMSLPQIKNIIEYPKSNLSPGQD